MSIDRCTLTGHPRRRAVHTSACHLLLAFGLLCGLGRMLAAQDDFDDFGPKPSRGEEVRERYESAIEKHRDDPETLVLTGLVADRKLREVEVLAEATGLAPEETAEFLLIGKGSSHGYEALLWSHAKPSHVHRALEFIGLEPGAPFNPGMLRFWADGDRVNLEVRELDGANGFPIEQLILDTETGETLPEEGFVFAGSMMVPPREGQAEHQYAADVYDPRSVASIYNEPAAVLDVPRQVRQGEVYGRQIVNPELVLEAGQLVRIVMAPVATNGRPRARELRLAFDYPAETNALVCRLTEDGSAVSDDGPRKLTDVLDSLVRMKKAGAAPFVTLSFDDALPVARAAKACTMMAMAESMGIARIRQPAEGQLYYRAFVPNTQWLKPKQRPSQPWELHLSSSQTNDTVTAALVRHAPVWSRDTIEPTYNRVEHAVPTPTALRKRLDEDARTRKEAGDPAVPKVLLVYAHGRMSYGDVVRFIHPVLDTHPVVYVFVTQGNE